MKNLFSGQGSVGTFFNRMGDLMLLNLLFIAGCLPVITAGASAAALHCVALRMQRGLEPDIVKDFFHSWRQNLKQGFVLQMLTLLLAAVLIVDVYVLWHMMQYSLFFKVLLFLLGIVVIRLFSIWLYLFPLLAQFDHTIPVFLNSARVLSRRHAAYTLAIFLITVFPVVLGALITYLLEWEVLLFLLMGFSVTAFLCARFYAAVFDRYMTGGEDTAQAAQINSQKKEAL